MSEVVVACCQLEPRIGELELGRARARAAILEAVESGARIVVLPELAVSGYVFADAGEARACAEPLDGPTVGEWTALAREHDLVIVGGVCEDGGSVLRNTSVILDRTGVRAAYHKAHLWDRESLFFEPGAERPAEVVRVQAGASSNRMFIAACDRCGTERGVEWVSGTAIVGPDGFPLAGPVCADEPTTIVARCALQQARDKRTSERNDVFADRRPELYA